MPLKVLKNHGVVASDGQLVSLSIGDLTLEQKAHIRMLCEQCLQSFVQKRGIGIWDYRLLDEEPIPDCFRYLVLKAAGGRCQLCGIAAKERPLDVDHIIPRSRDVLVANYYNHAAIGVWYKPRQCFRHR